MIRFSLLAGTAALLTPHIVLAQTSDATSAQQREDTAEHADPHQHHHGGDEIVVTGRLSLDILAGKSVLAGTELQRELRPQLGDTLTRLPGVSATSFSPGASRPVLRGFQGERIRVL